MPKSLKPKQLESILQELERPHVSSLRNELEQFWTPPDIASHILWSVDIYGKEIMNSTVLDLGCGYGILTIGCALLGAKRVVGVDIDSSVVELAKRNRDTISKRHSNITEDVSFMVEDVNVLNSNSFPEVQFDCVVMNPPFGATPSTSNRDTLFVEKALQFAPDVYSLHKSSTRRYWMKKQEQLKANVEVIEAVRFNIDRCYKYHTQKSKDVEVDFVHISRRP